MNQNDWQHVKRVVLAEDDKEPRLTPYRMAARGGEFMRAYLNDLIAWQTRERLRVLYRGKVQEY
jgi:hypothetical protein